ncbi:hypothetical protein [Xanthomonas cannabis]|uniref:Uncharacterized protein n=1 Tax=Xanthomonas cannabis TaxID=1885674 RepID=A0ABR6JKW5_9XANT|nr:hypothetical protein [Xanthomonas cannabis]MBB4593454.1 hypothetical protein [Xanthomonas cannabis]MBB5523109.1 hypothetical protein [Xanthomonas cannabis]
MQARRLILIATLTLGLLMNHPSAARNRPSATAVPDVGTSQQVPEGRPILQEWTHIGMSMRALERAYIESYEQSGFRLASRHVSPPPGGWVIELVFQLKSAPKGPNAPGTTLLIAGPRCPCGVSRQTFRWADVGSSDLAASARGERLLIKADTAALAKVRQRLGVSLPVIELTPPDAHKRTASPLAE